MALLATSDIISDLNTLATSDIVTDINLLATSDIVSDLNTLATSDIVSDLNTLATSDIVTDLNVLATSDIVTDINLLATSDIVSDLNTLATSAIVTDLNLLATTDAVDDMAILGASGVVANIATTAGAITNVNNVGGSIANVNTVASNLSGVNSFASRYRVDSSDPSSSLDEGDLAYNSTSNTLKYYNGSSWITIVAGSLTDVVQDGSPQLGGALDVNGNAIVSASNANISITPNGSGDVIIDGLKYPQSDGSSGQFLKTNGSAQLSWATVDTTIANDSIVEAKLDVSNAPSNGYFLQAQSGEGGGLTWAAVDLSSYAPLASPTLTGNPIAPTQSASNNSTRIATTAYADTAIANLVDSSPSALNTLNELAAALGDDANFSTTVTNSIATKAVLTGSTNNQLVSVTGANAISGEANLQFDGEVLKVLGNPTTVIGQDYNLSLDNDTDGATSGNAKTGILFRSAYNDNTSTDLAGITGGKENNSNGNYGSFISLNTRTNGVNSIAERVRITSTGNVGIGTNSPSAELHIDQAAGQITEIRASASSVYTKIIADDASGFSAIDFSHDLRFKDAGTERMRIASSGQLGIGGANYGSDGHVLTSTGASSAPAWEAIPGGGKILQVVSTTKNDTFTTNSENDYVDITGLSVAITPVATSSKILVLWHIAGSSGNNNTGMTRYRAFRGSTAISVGSGQGSRTVITGTFRDTYNNQGIGTEDGHIVDSPNTTSAVTYKIGTQGPAYINRSLYNENNDNGKTSASTITVMEIGA